MFLGIDIGTSSSKAVLVDLQGCIRSQAVRKHATTSQRQGWFEHDPEADWWSAVRELCGELRTADPAAFAAVDAMSVSGIGPCALLTDEFNRPLRSAILYGIDTRAEQEVVSVTAALGAERILEHAGNALSSQSVLPKLEWIRANEPGVFNTAKRWHCCSTWIAARLTGAYVFDHYTASVSSPLYDVAAQQWWPEPWESMLSTLEQPALVWPGEIVGNLIPEVANELGLRPGTLVVAGTIDAFAEAYGAGCTAPGDTMVMYGSTLFLITLTNSPARHARLWAASGRSKSTWALAAGLATGGLAASWMATTTRRDIDELALAASSIRPGAEGLVMLPYLAGERTPLLDPRASGCILGLTLNHTPAHLLRAVFEGTAFAIRHNLDVMTSAGAPPLRLVAVGGGTIGDIWPQIVSTVTGLPHDVPEITIGASYGDARAAAVASGIDTAHWNPVARTIAPNSTGHAMYEDYYACFLRLYPTLRDEMHLLARGVHPPVSQHVPPFQT